MYYVYILRSLKNKKYYIGCTGDVLKRLKRHNAGETKGNKGNRPFEVIYTEKFESLKEARQKEKYIKSQKSRNFIDKLLHGLS